MVLPGRPALTGTSGPVAMIVFYDRKNPLSLGASRAYVISCGGTLDRSKCEPGDPDRCERIKRELRKTQRRR
jgi:hypothetical protein